MVVTLGHVKKQKKTPLTQTINHPASSVSSTHSYPLDLLTREPEDLLSPLPVRLPLIGIRGLNALGNIEPVSLVGALPHLCLDIVRAFVFQEPNGRVEIVEIIRYDELQNLGA